MQQHPMMTMTTISMVLPPPSSSLLPPPPPLPLLPLTPPPTLPTVFRGSTMVGPMRPPPTPIF